MTKHLLAGQGSTGSRPRDRLKPEFGPFRVQDVCLLLNLFAVGHKQGLEKK